MYYEQINNHIKMEILAVACRPGLERGIKQYLVNKGMELSIFEEIILPNKSTLFPRGMLFLQCKEGVDELAVKRNISSPYKVVEYGPVSVEDLKRINAVEIQLVSEDTIGGTHQIKAGPFKGLVGEIIDISHEELTLMVNIFGRDTSVKIKREIPIDKVKKR